jgi:hypothetical protein
MDIPPLLIYSFNKYLLYTYYVLGPLLGERIHMKIVSVFKESTIYWEDRDNKTSDQVSEQAKIRKSKIPSIKKNRWDGMEND